MLTHPQFKEDRKKTLKNIFKGKSTKWIDDNIIYDFFNKSLILNEKDFKLIVHGLKNLQKLNLNQIKRILYWCEYSYTPICIMKKYIPKIIVPSPEFEQRGLVKYYIYNLPKNNIFVSFRGTKTFWEAINGLKFYRVPFLTLEDKDKKKFFQWRNKITKTNLFDQFRIPLPNDTDIEIHKGFLDEANLIYRDFIKTLSSIIDTSCPNTNIILCGHSLGGVLSQIIGIYLAYFLQDEIQKKQLNISIIGINTPPMGNKNFNLLMPYLGIKNFIRLYNYQDFVPHYGYLGSWIENKKFRHIDYMVNQGIHEIDNTQGRFIYNKIDNTQIYIKDYGKFLETFINDAKDTKSKNDVNLNEKYIFHDIIKLNQKEKALFI